VEARWQQCGCSGPFWTDELIVPLPRTQWPLKDLIRGARADECLRIPPLSHRDILISTVFQSTAWRNSECKRTNLHDTSIWDVYLVAAGFRTCWYRLRIWRVVDICSRFRHSRDTIGEALLFWRIGTRLKFYAYDIKWRLASVHTSKTHFHMSKGWASFIEFYRMCLEDFRRYVTSRGDIIPRKPILRRWISLVGTCGIHRRRKLPSKRVPYFRVSDIINVIGLYGEVLERWTFWTADMIRISRSTTFLKSRRWIQQLKWYRTAAKRRYKTLPIRVQLGIVEYSLGKMCIVTNSSPKRCL
jgi:hypothetical protein